MNTKKLKLFLHLRRPIKLNGIGLKKIGCLGLMFLMGCGNPLKSPATAKSGDAAYSSTMNAESNQVFNSINSIRVANGLPPLAVCGTCVKMAQEQSEDMVARGYFSHDRPAFPDRPAETFLQRVGRWGLGGGYVGENIAGSSSSEGAVQGWMNSSGHRANILNSNYASSGVGYKDGRWTQVFSSSSGAGGAVGTQESPYVQ